jgi:muramoyltetrapeptide carboxypeptidase
MLLQPPFLKKGDRIYILSTARKISIEEIAPAIETFKLWGLQVTIGETIGKQDNQYAGTDSERRQDFQRPWTTPPLKQLSARVGDMERCA